MALKHNREKGEVPLTVGGVDLVLVATFERLGMLEAALGVNSQQGMFERVMGAGPSACRAVLETLTVRGDPDKALAALNGLPAAAVLRVLPEIRDAAAAALTFDGGAEPDRGNGEAAPGKP
jgi:hypothetical protein